MRMMLMQLWNFSPRVRLRIGGEWVSGTVPRWLVSAAFSRMFAASAASQRSQFPPVSPVRARQMLPGGCRCFISFLKWNICSGLAATIALSISDICIDLWFAAQGNDPGSHGHSAHCHCVSLCLQCCHRGQYADHGGSLSSNLSIMTWRVLFHSDMPCSSMMVEKKIKTPLAGWHCSGKKWWQRTIGCNDAMLLS